MSNVHYCISIQVCAEARAQKATLRLREFGHDHTTNLFRLSAGFSCFTGRNRLNQAGEILWTSYGSARFVNFRESLEYSFHCYLNHTRIGPSPHVANLL